MVLTDPDRKLGEIMVHGRMITRDQLDSALEVQARSGALLGEILISLDYATDDQVAAALSEQLAVPLVAWKQTKPKWGPWAAKLSEEFCRANAALPLDTDGSCLAVAMVDPRNLVVRENLRLMTDHEIFPMLATKAQLLKAIDEFFSKAGAPVTARAPQEGDQSGTDVGLDDLSSAVGRINLDNISSRQTGLNVVDYVQMVMKQAITERASDIHFEAYHERVSLRLRIDGDLQDRKPPPWELYLAIVSRIKILAMLDIAEKRMPQDGAIGVRFQDRNIDFRISVCPSVYGENVVMRVLDRGSLTLDLRRLGMDPKQLDDFTEAAARPHGLILLTGPTGSGKTTTLYALLSHMRSPKLKIITAEDPVEYKLEGINQLQVRPDIGLTFAHALRCFLRQDPDVILVGEVRDLDTAEICTRAAMTGHLVLSTLHTNTALDAIARLVDMGVEPYLLASSLCLTAGQRLVRLLCPDCKRAYTPEAAVLEAVIKESLLSPAPDPATVTLFSGVGCSKCFFTGFRGRIAIYQVVSISARMVETIQKDPTNRALLQAESLRQGFLSIRASGMRKVLLGLTTIEEVVSVSVAD